MSEIAATNRPNNDPYDRARIEFGKVSLRMEPTDCRGLVEEIAATLRPLAETKGLTFEVVMLEPRLVIHTDRRALREIILHLAGNAIRFTDCGMVGITVDRVQENGRRFTHFHVVDTGIGIQPEKQWRIFHAPSPVESVVNPSHHGSGLGLHVCQKLAGLLGGEITFRSAQGKGSTFTLSLSEP